MIFDFEALLVLVTLVTGVIWIGDKIRRRRRKGERDGQPVSWWVDIGRSLFPVVLAVLIIRSFIVEPFRIPSGSMIPTLLPGDFILVSKFSYGLRLPITHTRIFGSGDPQRGDVMVFRYPRDPSEDYIKRVVGLPGDHIRYVDKQIYINGKPVPQMPAGAYDREPSATLRIEQLGDVRHEILLHDSAPDLSGSYTVPPGHYFVMGDNRDRSADSRFWGTVPEANLVGRAFLVWMSWDYKSNGVHWSRIGDIIQ